MSMFTYAQLRFSECFPHPSFLHVRIVGLSCSHFSTLSFASSVPITGSFVRELFWHVGHSRICSSCLPLCLICPCVCRGMYLSLCFTMCVGRPPPPPEFLCLPRVVLSPFSFPAFAFVNSRLCILSCLCLPAFCFCVFVHAVSIALATGLPLSVLWVSPMRVFPTCS